MDNHNGNKDTTSNDVIRKMTLHVARIGTIITIPYSGKLENPISKYDHY